MSFLGCDVGGTRSFAVLVTCEGDIVSSAQGAAANPHVLGFNNSADLIVELLTRALGKSEVCLKAITVCISGGESAILRKRYATHIRVRLKLTSAVSIIVMHDVIAPLGLIMAPSSAQYSSGDDTGKAPMAVIIAGTGSVAASFALYQNIDADARRSYCLEGKGLAVEMIRKCGGWGPVLGDAGSAFSIVRRALSLSLQLWDGMEVSIQQLGWEHKSTQGKNDWLTRVSERKEFAHSVLTAAIHHYCPSEDFQVAIDTCRLNKLVSFVYDKETTRGQISALALKLAALARAGNGLCAAVFEEAGWEIGQLLRTVLQVDIEQEEKCDYSRTKVCAVGGVFAAWDKAPDFVNGFRRSLQPFLQAGGRVHVLRSDDHCKKSGSSSKLAYGCAHLGAIAVGCSTAKWVQQAQEYVHVVAGR